MCNRSVFNIAVRRVDQNNRERFSQAVAVCGQSEYCERFDDVGDVYGYSIYVVPPDRVETVRRVTGANVGDYVAVWDDERPENPIFYRISESRDGSGSWVIS